jgi:hypothetical protein
MGNHAVRTTKNARNRESISVRSLSVPVMSPEIRYDMTVETHDDAESPPFSSSQTIGRITSWR